MNRALVAALTAGVTMLVGCGVDADIQMMTRELGTADRDAVLAAAQKALVDEFPRMSVDRDSYLIVTEPAEFNTTSDSGTSRDLIRAPSTMRHIARLAVAKVGDRTVARVRIDVERRDTSRRDVVSPEPFRISDSPSYSPIERDAARSSSQNTVWTKVRRDSRLERAILDELEKSFAPEPAASAP